MQVSCSEKEVLFPKSVHDITKGCFFLSLPLSQVRNKGRDKDEAPQDKDHARKVRLGVIMCKRDHWVVTKMVLHQLFTASKATLITVQKAPQSVEGKKESKKSGNKHALLTRHVCQVRKYHLDTTSCDNE